jgi:hypothetical protein
MRRRRRSTNTSQKRAMTDLWVKARVKSCEGSW